MKCVIALGTLLLVSSVSAAAEPPNAELEKAARFVRDLGDVRFKVRETAARELQKLGRFAKPALLEGMKSTDPEVWTRCGQLLPEIMALDLKARVDAFLADTEGEKKHDLPMMERFRKMVGADAASRKLFVEIVKSNANFLEACELNPKLASEKYALRAAELHQQLFGTRQGGSQPQINAADIGALLVIGADPELSKGISTSNVNHVSNLLWQQPFQNALRTGEQAAPLRKLFFVWADNRADVNSVSQTLSIIQQLNLKEGLDFAVKVMKMKDQQIWTRAQALIVVGKMGGKDQVLALEALFDDKTPVANIQWNNININTQLNDVALAMAVQLSGQQPKDYGFDALQSQPTLIWAYHYLGFSIDSKRDAAFKKWKDWSAAEKKKK